MNFKNYTMYLICFVTYFLIGYSVCFCQDPVLVDANNGLEGGIVMNILYSAEQSLLCGTTNGLYRWSNDQWEKEDNFPSIDVRWLLTDTLDRLFAGGMYIKENSKSGLFRSDDDGKTWIDIPFPNPYFQGVFYDSTKNRTFVSSETNLYCSADNGETWEPLGLEGLSSCDIVLNSEGHIFAACYGFGVYRSTDDGLTWTDQSTGIESKFVTRLLVDKSGDMFCGNHFGEIYKSSDNSDTWTKSTSTGGSTGFIIRSEKYNSIFAGSLMTLYQYTDQEQQWKNISENKIGYLSFHCILEHQNDGLLIGTGGAGVIYAKDINGKWELINKGMYCANISCFAETQSGDMLVGTEGMKIFRSDNNGTSWVPSDSGLLFGDCYCLEVSKNGTVFAGTSGYGMYYSKDDGNTWKNPNASGPFNRSVHYCAVNSSEHLYAPSDDYRLARVKNTDTTAWVWEIVDITNYTDQYPVTNIAINSKDQIFVVLSQTDILRSSDNGDSWQSIREGLPEESIFNIAFGKGENQDIYVTLLQGIYKSEENATAWKKISGWPEPLVTYAIPVCVDPKKRIYVGMGGKLYYKDLAIDTSWKTFQGYSWNSENMALFLNSSGHIFGGTMADGAYRSEKSVSISLPHNADTNSDKTFLFIDNHSTLNGKSVLNFSLKKPSKVSLKVFDALGKEVRLLANGLHASGLHSVSFYHKNLSNGVYFIHLQAGTRKILKKMTVLK